MTTLSLYGKGSLCKQFPSILPRRLGRIIMLLLPHNSNEFVITCMCPKWKGHQHFHSSRYPSSCEGILAPTTHYPTPSAGLVRSMIVSCISSVGRHGSGKRDIVSMADGTARVAAKYSEACKHEPHAITHAITFAAKSSLSSCSLAHMITMKNRFRGKLLFAMTE